MMIKITLPKDRTKLGVLEIENKKFKCYGKADNAGAIKRNNPTRDPLKLFGDTPTGTYKCYVTGPLSPPRTYGPHKVIYLGPEKGQCKKAEVNGRSGLLIHGGDLGTKGNLRPTFGCIRVSNEDMKKILDILGPNVLFFWTEIVEIDG